MFVNSGLNGFIIVNDKLMPKNGITTALTEGLTKVLMEELGIINKCYMTDQTHLEICLMFANYAISWPTILNCQKYLKEVCNIDSYIGKANSNLCSINLNAMIPVNRQDEIETLLRMKGYV